MKKRHGISIMEVVIAISIFSIVVLMGSNAVQSTAKIFNQAQEEEVVQSSMRLSLETITERVKEASAVFLMPETSFREDNLTKGWSYFGMMERNGKEEIVLITYNFETHSHEIKTLVDSSLGYEYRLEFRKKTEGHDDKQIQFILQAYESGNPVDAYIDLSAEVEAFNTLQIVNWASDSNKSTAIAFRTEDRSETVVGRLVFIIDRSGSMDFAMGGAEVPITNDSERRVNIMKKAATQFITDFQGETVEIGMITFANDADAPKSAPYNGEYKFLPLETYMGELVDGIRILTVEGATNTGDALRRARYLFHDSVDKPEVSYKNYVILLVDGDTTYGTIDKSSLKVNPLPEGSDPDYEVLYNYYHGRGQFEGSSQPELIPFGEGAYFGTVGGTYTLETGQKLIDEIDVKPYVIALSSDVGTNGLTNIKNALGITDPSQLLQVLEEDELQNAFSAIRDEILNEMWYITGPKL